jgi:signal transduction histidine kinase
MFLANMSHELRTPLNSVIGFSEVLMGKKFGGLNEKQVEYLHEILTSGEHLLSLINDILDLSKVEAGKILLEPEEIDLRRTLETSLTIVRQMAVAQRISLELDTASAPETIVADLRRFKQIVYNLLSNAVKFTPNGAKVGIIAHREEDSTVITVWDTGIGISEEGKQRLFKPFEQLDGSPGRKYEGTGLGLVLVKQLVELHGGRVWVESEERKGSRFHFSIPLSLTPVLEEE